MSKRRRVAAPSDSVLEINVGGTIFVTKKSTLSFENDSMLARLFDDESPFGELPRDQSDRVFLDRDPAVFGVVLEYLRCAGRLVGATARSADELSRVKEQAEFFGLSGLVSAFPTVRRRGTSGALTIPPLLGFVSRFFPICTSDVIVFGFTRFVLQNLLRAYIKLLETGFQPIEGFVVH